MYRICGRAARRLAMFMTSFEQFAHTKRPIFSKSPESRDHVLILLKFFPNLTQITQQQPSRPHSFPYPPPSLA